MDAVLLGGAGVDTLIGGGGNGTLLAVSVSDLASADGVADVDRLRFTTLSDAFDAASLVNLARHIETMNLRNGTAGGIDLSALALTSTTDNNHVQPLHLDSSDVLNLAADTQTQTLSSGTDGSGNSYTMLAVLAQQGANWVQTSTLNLVVGAGG